MSELESCPHCGALPCDWVDNPHAQAASPDMPDPLTADFTRALPGGKLDDATYEAIESALDRAGAAIQDGARWLTLPERVDALGRVIEGLNRQLTEQFDLSTKFAAAALKAERDREALLASLRDFLENPLFQVGVGGNPIAVDAMLARAREAIAKAEGRT